MKPFVTRYSMDQCKTRLAQLQSDGFLGFIQVNVKFVPFDGGQYHYVLWKTMRGNMGHKTTLAEVEGVLTVREDQSMLITGHSRMGRFYRVLFVLYGFVLGFGLLSYLSTHRLQHLVFVVLMMGFMGIGWLLTFYWRNQLEGMIERALLGK